MPEQAEESKGSERAASGPVFVLFSAAGKRRTVLGTDHLGRGANGTRPWVLGVFFLLFWLQPVAAAWLRLWGGGGALLGDAARAEPADRHVRGALSIAMTVGIAAKNCANFVRHVGGKVTVGVDSALIIHAFILSIHGSAALVAWPFPEPSGWVPWAALGVYLVFASVEVAADEQLGAFCRAKAKPGYAGPLVMTAGLWRLSRHPNFAANTFYYSWGLGLLSGTWIVPLAWNAVFVMFYHLQAIPGHEAHMARRNGAEWTRYRENTPKYLFS